MQEIEENEILNMAVMEDVEEQESSLEDDDYEVDYIEDFDWGIFISNPGALVSVPAYIKINDISSDGGFIIVT